MSRVARRARLEAGIICGLVAGFTYCPGLAPSRAEAADCGCRPSDFDRDGDVDLDDFAHLQACLTGQFIELLTEACEDADLNGEGLIEQNDLSIFLGCLSGPGVPVDLSGLASLQITEFMASNGQTLADEDGDFSDWIEIHNPCLPIVDLDGWYLTDDSDDPTKWRLPAVRLGRGEYLVVFASDKDRADPTGELHTNFKLTSAGEYLALVAPDGETVTQAFAPAYPEQLEDVSYGLVGGSESRMRYLATPTPGEPNVSGVADFVRNVAFSTGRGFYELPFLLWLSTPSAGADIYYTRDGSEPTETNGTLYTGPITVPRTTVVRAAGFKPDALDSKVVTHSYIFLEDVLAQPGNPAMVDGTRFPSTWGGTTADYQMDPDVLNDPQYGPLMKDALLSLPTISIVTSLPNLFSGSRGIYTNSTLHGVAWERSASAEFFTPDGSQEFQVNCGLRIHGGAFRNMGMSRKKSFRLLFKRDYGPSKLDFPLFGHDGAVDRFDTIVLRASANDAWNSWGNADAQYIRDEFARRTQLALGQPASHGRYVHLYVDGLYWGLYNPVERPEASFAASYFGGDKDTWDALKHRDPEVIDGNINAWNAMLSQVRAGLSSEAAYQRIQGNNPDGTPNPAYQDLIDVENYIGYLATNFFTGNVDWPGNNWYAARNRVDSTGFKFFCWDGEWSMGMRYDLNVNRTGVGGGVAEPYTALRQNPEFRLLFADHAQRALFNDGALTPEAVVARYQALADDVELAIMAESARWGDQAAGAFYTPEDWRNMRDTLLDSHLPARPAALLNHLRGVGLYPGLSAPTLNRHGGAVPRGFELTMAKSVGGPGTIYYTLDGTDPRTRNGGVHPEAQIFEDDTRGFTLVSKGATWRYLDDGSNQGTAWRELGFDASGWDAGRAELGYGDANVVTVVGYGPDANNKFTTTYFRHRFGVTDASQFTQLSLGLMRDDGAVVYLNGQELERPNLPDGEIGYLTWAIGNAVGGADESTFFRSEEDPALLVEGPDNLLAVEIHQNNGRSSDISFDLELLGLGSGNATAAIVLTENVHVKARVFDGNEWSALTEATFAVGTVGLAINEFMADNETTLEDPDEPGQFPDWLELYNGGLDPIDLGGMYLTDDVDAPTLSPIPDGVSIAPGEFLLFWADGEVWQGDRHTNFKLSREGEAVALIDVDGQTVIDAVTFDLQSDDVSQGRFPDGTGDWGFSDTPTPGTANAPHQVP